MKRRTRNPSDAAAKVYHLRFRVDDFDAMTVALAREGVDPLFHQRFPGIAAFAYMKTDKTSGLMVELFEMKESKKDLK